MEENNFDNRRKKTIFALGLSSFLNDLGAEIVHSVWPVFVREILKAPMSALGIIDGLGEGTVNFSQAISGYLSDKVKKRKLFIWLGYLLSGISRIGYAFSSFWTQLIPFKIFDRAGKIRDTPRDALVMEIADHKRRVRTFGFLEAMDHLGAVSGIILAIILIKILSIPKMFILAAIPSVFAVCLVLQTIKERARVKKPILKFFWKNLSSNLKKYFFAHLLFALGFFSYSFLLIYARETGWSVNSIPILYLIIMASMATMAYPTGRLADILGKKKVIILAYLFWALAALGFSLGFKNSLVVPLVVLFGFAKAALRPSQVTFILEKAPAENKASILGFFLMASGFFYFLASFLAGLLWETFGREIAFSFAFLTSILAIFLMLFVKERRI